MNDFLEFLQNYSTEDVIISGTKRTSLVSNIYQLKRKMLKKISIGLALTTLIICLILYGEHLGFEKGWELAGDFWSPKTPDSPSFSGGVGPTTYGFLLERYFLICLFLLGFIISKLKEEISSQIVSTALLCFITYQFWQIYNWYADIIEYMPHYSTDMYFSVLRNSVSFIWLCFIIVLTLFTIQMIQVRKYFIDARKPIS